MMDKKYYLGLDIGTSSVKAILRSRGGDTIKTKRGYTGYPPKAWLDAVREAISELTIGLDGEIAAVSVSSQVGTYVINGCEVIPWSCDVGKNELEYIKSLITEKEFLCEIGMKHPDIISYPLPRLLYIQNKYGKGCEVLMPKELVIRALTGNTVTDVFSMRGICDPSTGKYADGIMKKIGIEIALPTLSYPTSPVGLVTAEAAKGFGLKEGTPVYLGCNDFFAGLLGMGIYNDGDFFDLSGTSEHVGYISEDINPSGFVSGKYFVGSCTYGGTKSSGASNDLAINGFGLDGLSLELLKKSPPIFLPYLNGERAPIYDENARGVFLGLNLTTDKKTLAYSILEGVVFSLYDIATSMNAPKPKRIICGGGSARDPFMNKLRATVFDCEVTAVCENDTSALGACIIAMVGNGAYPDLASAISEIVSYTEPIKPESAYRNILMKRFEIYKEVYQSLKYTFKKLSDIQEEKL